MTIEEVQAALRKFRDERDWMQFHNPKDMAAALAIEASELQELFLWKKNDEVEGIVFIETRADLRRNRRCCGIPL